VYFFNAIGRDGMYYEGSFGYSLFTGTVFLDIALLAMRASDEDQLRTFHPFGCSRFFRFAVENPLDMLCQGHLPSYGDWGADSSVGSGPNLKLAGEAYRAALFFYQFSPDADMRRKAEETLGKLYPLLKDQFGGKGIDLFFNHPVQVSPEPFTLPQHNTVMGQAGIAILRDQNGSTIMTRVGPNHTHAHDDVLAYNYYACGLEISADIGYGIYGTNAHYGWGSKAIAHNTVVVNKDSQMKFQQMYKPFAGGEFTFLYESDEVSAIEGKAPGLYGIEAYQRMLATVPAGAGASYVMDFFYIEGAETTDYAFHAFHEKSTLEIRGAERVEVSHWTLSGIDASEKPYFDQPGQSFGERLTAGETFSTLLEGEEPRLWTPQINNGYGYIYSAEEYRTYKGGSEAIWTSESGVQFRWFGLQREDERLFVGECPSLEGTYRYPILVLRSEKPSMLYAAASCAAEPDREACVKAIHELPVSGERARAVRIELEDGSSDYWVYSDKPQRISVSVGNEEWVIEGRCAWMRLDQGGNVLSAQCISAHEMSFRDIHGTGRQRPEALVLQADADSGKLQCNSAPTAWAEAEGPRTVRIIHKEKSSWYSIEPVGASQEMEVGRIVLRDSFILSKGMVAAVRGDVIVTRYPLPLGVTGSADGPSAFQGKQMIGKLGGQATILRIPTLKELVVDLIKPFEIDEAFDIVDVVPGCKLEWV
jgi:hypothetical protein